MADFTESSDKRFIQELIDSAPKQAGAWLNFDKQVGEDGTLIPQKYKELISIAVALTTQCPYCLERHVRQAKESGVTQTEIGETIMIAAALRSGAALGYGLLTMKLFKDEKL